MVRRRQRRATAQPGPIEASPPPSYPPARVAGAPAAACGLVAFLVYLRTLSSTTSHGDSGELIAVARTLGIAHPPGYPLHALLGHLFTLFPVSSVAWRVNLLSAVCDAAAAALLCQAVQRASGRLTAGVLAAGAFAFSPVVWPYAITAEVFALNNLFVALLLQLSTVAVLADAPHKRRRATTASAFVLGLGLTNHHTLVLAGGPLVLWLACRELRTAFDARRLGALAGAFALGLLPYLYLPIADARRPEVAWGDFSTLAGFLDHLLRREYGTFRLGDESVGGGGQLAARLTLFAARLTRSTLGAAPLLLAATLWARRDAALRRVAGPWLAALALYVVVFASLSNLKLEDPLHVTVEDRFWQQAVVIAAACMGLGLATLERRLPPRIGRAAALVGALGLPGALLALHARALDRSGHTFFRDYGVAILDSLPPNALLLITSDEAVGSVRALQLVEGRRPDVTVLPTGQLTARWFRRFAQRGLPRLTLPEGTFTARQFVDANSGRFPIFLVNKLPWLQTLEEAYSPWPVGLADQVLPKGSSPALETWVDTADASFGRFDPGAPSSHAAGSWERYVATNYWKQYDRFALSVVGAAATRADLAGARAVVRTLETVARRHPAPPATVFKNLGVAYHALSREDPAALEPTARHWRRYLDLNPADPEAAAIRSLIGTAEASARPAKAR